MPFDPAPIRRQPRLGQAHGNVRPALTIAPPPASQPQHGIATKGYDAARQDRLTSDWTVSRLSADAELQGKLPIIRDRFREHARNEPLAKNFLTLVENNVVGDQGFAFESKVVKSRTIDPETGEEVTVYDAEVCRKVERAWKQFGHRDTFLTTRNMDMTAAWKLIARTMWGDGDCLLRLVRGYPNKFGFAVQLLEPDFLDDQFIEFRGVPCNCPEELTLPDGRPFPRCQRGLHQVRMGCELHGDWMFPLAYWILADHPGDYFFGNQYNTRRTRVPVSDMIHPFVYKRIGQTRGVSEMEASMLRMMMLGGMDEATLVKARAAAQKIGLIEKDIPDSIVDQFADDYSQHVPTMDCEPGGMLELPPGFKFKPWDPQDPSPQYESFTDRQERMIAIGSGVAATSLTGNLKNVNFSSIRTGVLEEREGWKGRQRFFIAETVRRVFEAFVPMAILSGQLDVPMSLVEAIIDQEAACFQGRRWPWVDPLADAQAEQAMVEAGWKSNSDVCAESGRDFEKVTASLGREKRMRAAEGLLPPEETAAGASGGDNPGAGNGPADLKATKNAPLDEPRDPKGEWTAGGDHPGVGKEGDWASLGLPSAEELDPIPLPARMGRSAAMEKLSTPYVKEDPLGNAIGFGSRLKGHLDEHITEGDHARPGFLPHMEATVENPVEIWSENTPKGPRLRHIAAFTSKSGRKSFTVVSHQTGETRATVVTGIPYRHTQLNQARKGRLLYVRPKAG